MNRHVVAALAAVTFISTPLVAQTQFEWHAGRESQAEQSERVERRLRLDAERLTRRLVAAAERTRRRIELSVERSLRRSELQRSRALDRIRTRIRRDLHSPFYASGVGSRSQGWLEQGAFDGDPCHTVDRRDRDDDYTHCEVREEQLPAGALAIDARPNGGIRVEAWDGSDIRVRAIVQAHARTLEEAKALAGRVQVQAGGGRVSASGPDSAERGRREWWSVSYRVHVPRRTDLDLNSVNGSISIDGVSGTQRFQTSNGAVTLRDLAGSVRGGTRNGAVRVALGGGSWNGDGLDVETSNGAVTVAIPDGYNGQLDTRTANGSARFDYPMTVVGDLTARRGVTATLGSGGPPVRARTTNGRLSIERR